MRELNQNSEKSEGKRLLTAWCVDGPCLLGPTIRLFTTTICTLSSGKQRKLVEEKWFRSRKDTVEWSYSFYTIFGTEERTILTFFHYSGHFKA